MYKQLLFLFFTVLVFFIYLSNYSVVFSACDPAECGEVGAVCDSSERCLAKCCVPKESVPTSGNGWTCPCGNTSATVCKQECSSQDNPFCGYVWRNGVAIGEKYECEEVNCLACPTCDITPPNIVSFTNLSNTSTKINWNYSGGVPGVLQKAYVGANLNQITNNCPQGVNSPACVYANDGFSIGTRSLTVTVPANRLMNWKIANYKFSGCEKYTIAQSVSSCTVNTTNITLKEGETATLTSNFNTNDNITRVNFLVADTTVVTANPVNIYPPTTPYSTIITAQPGSAGKSTTVNTRIILSGEVLCSKITTVNVELPENPWWQVKDADITAQGNIVSKVPSGKNLVQKGTGGYPGVPVALDTISTSPGSISEASFGWNASTATSTVKTFNYDYFESLIPEDVVFERITSTSVAGTVFSSGGDFKHGYYWYLFDGTTAPTLNQNLTISSAVNIAGNRKVILFVKGAHLTTAGSINIGTAGQGFFAAFIEKDFLVSSAVGNSATYDLEGIFFSDGTFSTGSGNKTFKVRGSIAALTGTTFSRNLVNNTNPAEHFTFSPDLVLLFPKELSYKETMWLEVAP